MSDNELQTVNVTETGEEQMASRKKKSRLWLYILIGVLILAGLAVGVFFLARAGAGTTSQIRDIFIILTALIALVIGAALIILIIQLAVLINLLQNEIKPILKSTTDTVNTVKGTTTFISDNLTNPVIKISSTVAGLRRFVELVGLFTKKPS